MAHSSNIHDVKRISAESIQRRYRQNGEVYFTSGLIIETDDTRFEINLFAEEAAKLAIAQPAAEMQAEEPAEPSTFWLIEAGDPPHYWDGRSLASYTADPNDAVRFGRFRDAESVRLHLIPGGVHWKSVEHAGTP